MNNEKNKEVFASISQDGAFIIKNYNHFSAFASFLPGIAGAKGKPMWVFYVNRCQAIAGFGVNSKDGAIMEFVPANKAYNLVFTHGFRTFIKFNDAFYEPFSAGLQNYNVNQTMIVRAEELELIEENSEIGLQTSIVYYTLAECELAALIRRVEFKNNSSQTLAFTFLDGMPFWVPCNIKDSSIKGVSNTKCATVEISNLESNMLFCRSTVNSSDAINLEFTSAGHFYYSFRSNEEGLLSKIIMIADPKLIFGEVGSFIVPLKFIENGIKDYTRQRKCGYMPCAMSYDSVILEPGEKINYYSIIGKAPCSEKALQFQQFWQHAEQLDLMRVKNCKIIKSIADRMFTVSSNHIFDYYCSQTFLDNVLRGGLPVMVGNKPIYLFFRKHGDLERDYNAFYLASTYYSQGNGNYRDINQNRRCDGYFCIQACEENIKIFFNAISADGNNPLVYEGTKFNVTGSEESLRELFLNSQSYKSFLDELTSDVTPGEIFDWALQRASEIICTPDEFLEKFVSVSKRKEIFKTESGFWSDHWSYCIDLLESFVALQPDHIIRLLFECEEFTYFDNPQILKPRSERYAFDTKYLTIRQYESLMVDREKLELIKSRKEDQFLVRSDYGKAEVYRTILAEKILCLIAAKICQLDIEGLGIEMNGNKPGWNDALNGLPSLLGSSICETAELLRLIIFLYEYIKVYNRCLSIASEIAELLQRISVILSRFALTKSTPHTNKECWNALHEAFENYIKQIRLGFSGIKKQISAETLLMFLKRCHQKCIDGISKAYDETSGLYRTYFYYNSIDIEFAKDEKGETGTAAGYPIVTNYKLVRRDIPFFLEGQMRVMKILPPEKKEKLYHAVKKSELFDPIYKMYKLNFPLEGVPQSVGRATIFPRGWLENESIWMHMEFKYLLEILKAGLYENFFADIQNALPPFIDPFTYGRSPLENCSFIVPSVYLDPTLHGKGFYARLSGATIEWISIYLIMAGISKPFFVDEYGNLCFQLLPILPNWIFTRKKESKFLITGDGEIEVEVPANAFCCRFLNCCTIIYLNPSQKHTFGTNASKIVSMQFTHSDGAVTQVEQSYVSGQLAHDIRNGKISKIDVILM